MCQPLLWEYNKAHVLMEVTLKWRKVNKKHINTYYYVISSNTKKKAN